MRHLPPSSCPTLIGSRPPPGRFDWRPSLKPPSRWKVISKTVTVPSVIESRHSGRATDSEVANHEGSTLP
jgi:hypothetical protein